MTDSPRRFTIDPDPSRVDLIEFLSNETETVFLLPENLTQARRMCSNRRGEGNGAVRRVVLNRYAFGPLGSMPEIVVRGPKDGRPVVIEINAGIGKVHVTEGNAIIRAASLWGNSVKVSGSARVVVLLAAAKVTIEAAQNARVSVYGDEDTRGSRRATEGAQIAYYESVDPSLVS